MQIIINHKKRLLQNANLKCIYSTMIPRSLSKSHERDNLRSKPIVSSDRLYHSFTYLLSTNNLKNTNLVSTMRLTVGSQGLVKSNILYRHVHTYYSSMIPRSLSYPPWERLSRPCHLLWASTRHDSWRLQRRISECSSLQPRLSILLRYLSLSPLRYKYPR